MALIRLHRSQAGGSGGYAQSGVGGSPAADAAPPYSGGCLARASAAPLLHSIGHRGNCTAGARHLQHDARHHNTLGLRCLSRDQFTASSHQQIRRIKNTACSLQT